MVTEEDMIETTTITALYLEVKEDVIECSFRSFEVVTATNTTGNANVSLIKEYLDDFEVNCWQGSQGQMWFGKESLENTDGDIVNP